MAAPIYSVWSEEGRGVSILEVSVACAAGQRASTLDLLGAYEGKARTTIRASIECEEKSDEII